MEHAVMRTEAMQMRTLGLLWQMHDAASFVIEWTKDASGEITGDRTLTMAIERQVGVVGEAARRLDARDPETAKGIPGLEEAVLLLDMLLLEYDNVDYARLTNFVNTVLPGLDRVAASLLELYEDSIAEQR